MDSAELLKCELAAETLRFSLFLRLRVTGSSMLPTIWPGDILEISRRSIGEVSIGEIALFECYGRLVAHRVIGCDGSSLIAQGDTIPNPDPPVTEAALLGVVSMITRGRRQFHPPVRRSIASRMTAAVARRSPYALRWLQRVLVVRAPVAAKSESA